MSIDHLRVSADRLNRPCDPDELGFETTAEIDALAGTIGQERALSALDVGLQIEDKGYNVYVSGLPGTGRNTALRSYLDRIAIGRPTPPDWGYVYNFQDSSQPIAISLPCGMMKVLVRDMDDLVAVCKQEIPKAFESDDYTRRIEQEMEEIQQRRQQVSDQMDAEARQAGFALTQSQVGVTPVPMKDGRPMTPDEFKEVSEDDLKALRVQAEDVQHMIRRRMADFRRLNKETSDKVQQVDKEVVLFTLTPLVDELQEKYADEAPVVAYLENVQEDMVTNLEIFKPTAEASPPALFGMPRGAQEEDIFVRYRVNDLVDNTECGGAPVVYESSPTYYNLFGRIDYRARVGTFTTDLTMIESGAIHRANGGYLVVQARDLLTSPLAWDTLKRTLRSGEVRIENMGEQMSPIPTTTMRPQSIPIDTTIVMVGTPALHRVLQMADEDFQRYFKVTAEFDTIMDRTDENLMKYAAFVAARCESDGLRPFHKTAVARIIDHSSRLVDHQEKLTTRFMDVADLVTEANYWAGVDGGDVVFDTHVKKAVDHKRYRSALTENRLQEFIEDGTIHIDTDGDVIGQINGLAVMSFGDYMFGKPSRITARVSLGKGQLVNVERESRLSGRIHDKGFTILTGYLNAKYGRDKPLSLNASIGFEQSYSEIDGDSASSTELYALLSELSGLPIKQSFAVTGSVNQNGAVQAIGGGTAKIEGFFDLCAARGLTDEQGVMLPYDNVKNLVLKDEVREAVTAGKFHIYGVRTIDEGIEILTGVPAGEVDSKGHYPEGTVHWLVEKRLEHMADAARAFGKDDKPEDSKASENEEKHEADDKPKPELPS